MSVKERIVQYVRYKKISNSAFCRAIGVSNAFISSMRKSIQPDKIESIALSFPDLNVGWLLTGEGVMLKSSPLPATLPLSEETELAKMMRELLKAKDQVIAEKELLLVEKDKRLLLLEELLVASRQHVVGNRQ